MSVTADGISDLEFFVLLARSGSLTAAAQQLGVTAPTVSKRLAALEGRLGVRLMQRTTRRVGLTAEGEAYLSDGSRLHAVLPEWEAPPADIVALYPTKQNLSAKTRVFVEFLARRFEAWREGAAW